MCDTMSPYMFCLFVCGRMLIMIKPMELQNYKVKVQRRTLRDIRREINNQVQQPRLMGRMPNRVLKLLIHLRRNTYMLGLAGVKQQTAIALQKE